MISMRSLRRLQRELARFEAEVDKHYPHATEEAWSSPLTETIRNALTAQAELTGWISFRQQHRRDMDHPRQALSKDTEASAGEQQ